MKYFLFKALFAGHLAWALGSVSDLASTRYAIHNGAVEMNPLAGQTLGRQVAVIAISGAAIEIGTHILGHKHPLAASAIRWEAGSIHFAASGWNLHVVNQIKEREHVDRQED